MSGSPNPYQDELDPLRDCLCVDPREHYSDFPLLQDRQKNISFDLWECGYCGEVFTTLDTSMCVSCKKTYCHGHTEALISDKHHCVDCQSFWVCHECRDNVPACHCKCYENGLCESCVSKGTHATCEGSEVKPGCKKLFTRQLCDRCEKEEEAGLGSTSQCTKCKCVWCDS